MKTQLLFFALVAILCNLLDANAQIQKGSDIDGEAAGDRSGWSVSMPYSNTLAIGAPQNDGNGSDAGHVRIYRWNGSTWVQKGSDIDGEAAGDESGSSVSMPDSNTIAIGALQNDGNGTDAGHVRVYSLKSNITPTGIVEMSESIKINAYPNPSAGLVRLNIEQVLENVQITVTDLRGKVVFTKQIDAAMDEFITFQAQRVSIF